MSGASSLVAHGAYAGQADSTGGCKERSDQVVAELQYHGSSSCSFSP